MFADQWRKCVVAAATSNRISSHDIVDLVRLWEDKRSNWELIASMGKEIEKGYWKGNFVRALSEDPDDLAYQINHLVEAKRAPLAFSHICWQSLQVPAELMLLVFDSTFSHLASLQTEEEAKEFGIKSYDITSYLEKLRQRKDIETRDIAQREYTALPIIGSLDAKNLLLHEFMRDDPKFFVDVLCDVFLPAHRDKGKDDQPSTEQRARATAAYTLLEGLEEVPGFDKGVLVSSDQLRAWIADVRLLSTERDRQKIGEQRIGAVLAHAPVDPSDSAWPHIAVRDSLEALSNAEVERGLAIERFNMRGVTSRAPVDGGRLERDLAKTYEEWAATTRNRWPKVAQMLDAIADDWMNHARWHDERAKQDELD